MTRAADRVLGITVGDCETAVGQLGAIAKEKQYMLLPTVCRDVFPFLSLSDSRHRSKAIHSDLLFVSASSFSGITPVKTTAVRTVSLFSRPDERVCIGSGDRA